MTTTFRNSVSAIILAIASQAYAQPATVQAQSLFDEGRKLLDAGKIAEACTAFEASQKLDPAITTLLNLADCREQNHQLASAWGTFEDANRMARAANNDKLAKVASNHSSKLEPRLSHLTVTVAHPVAGLEITRGKDNIDGASWNHTLPIDGGVYTITAKAPGREPWLTTIEIKQEGESRTLEIPELTPSAVVAAPVHGAPNNPMPVDRVDTPVTTSRAVVVPIVLGGAAVVLGLGGVLLDLSGDSTFDQAKASTNQAQRDALESSANHKRYIAEGFGVAAIGAAGAALYLYFSASGQPRATALAPMASPHGGGIAVFGHW
ncbi:MAG TPA: hypothetical protein VGO00_10610 [Kofleriaceae bacterium]|jgi:hypothetical protein|nr:hypothetical protein [Kofleriaceae bacterium]